MNKEFSVNKLRSVFLVGFLLTIALALTNYIDSSFLGIHIQIKDVGLIFSAGSFTAIIFLSFLPKLVKRIGVRGVFHLASLMYLVSVLGMLYTTISAVFIILFILYIASGYGLYFTIDMLIERVSNNKNEGTNRGIYLTIYNLAYLIGPLIAGSILKNSSFNLLYLTAGMFIIIMSLIFVRDLEKIEFPPTRNTSFKTLFQRLIKSKNLINVYIVSLMLSFFFSWMAIFIPIYLKVVMGFDWQQIGMIFAIMHIPYITLEFPFGRLADKYNCERKLMIIGLVIIAISTAMLWLLNTPNFWLWSLALTITRVGSSFVQVGSESYFFKKVDSQDTYMIAMFRYTSPIAYIIGPLVATGFLVFFAYNDLFPILGLIMLGVALFSFRLRKIKS
jgi:MFS family permease